MYQNSQVRFQLSRPVVLSAEKSLFTVRSGLRSTTILAGFLFLVLVDNAPAVAQTLPVLPFRSWEDNTGNFKIDASLRSISDDSAELLLKDGRSVNVPLRRFCESDAKYVEMIRRTMMEKTAGIEPESVPVGPESKPNQLPDRAVVPPLQNNTPQDTNTKNDPETPADDDFIIDLEGLPIEKSEARLALPPPKIVTEVDLNPAFLADDLPPVEIQDELAIPDYSTPKLSLLPSLDTTAEGINSERSTDLERALDLNHPTPPTSLSLVQADHPLVELPNNESNSVPAIALKPDIESSEMASNSGETSDAGDVIPQRVGAGDIPEAVAGMAETEALDSQPGIIGLETARPTLSVAPATTDYASGQTTQLSKYQRSTINQLLEQISATDDPEKLRDLFARIDMTIVPLNDSLAMNAFKSKLDSADKFVRETAFLKIAKLSNRPSLELLKTGIADESQAIRWHAYNLISNSPSEEMLPVLVERMRTFDRNKIISVLEIFGSKCEPFVLPLLEAPELRLDVIRLLADVGTADSIKILERSMAENTFSTVESLQSKETIRKIQDRIGE